MSVVVFADAYQGKFSKSAFEAITYASKVAAQKGTNTVAVTYGTHDDAALAALGNYGANKVIVAKNVTDVDSQQLAKLVAGVANDEGAEIVVISQDPTGKAVAPRVAVKLNAGMVAGAVDLPNMDGGFTVKKTVFSGKAFAHVAINTDKKVIALTPNSIMVEAGSGSAEVAEYTGDLGSAGITVKEVKKTGGALSLPEAELVVSAGRGLKGPENWGIVEELAESLGAATACSRPVADMGWRPHHEHVGQTGVAIRPNLYIAAGISGAIQHLAGVNSSKVIVVINTDPEAPFFKAADYGIVGDAFEVLPKLTEAAKKFAAES